MEERHANEKATDGFDEAAAREKTVARRPMRLSVIGDAMTSSQASVLTHARRCTVALLAGSEKSGKTTFITALYERFGQGPIAGWSFAGSYTLRGLENRCHRGRVESGLSAPQTERTHRHDPPWLHLRLRRIDGDRESIDLLFGDLSGEWFEDFADGRIPAAELPYLPRLDHLSLVLDGERLTSESSREQEVQRALRLVRLLLQDPVLPDARGLEVVITKWDHIARKGAEAVKYTDAVFNRLAKVVAVSANGIEPRLFRTAARSELADLPSGHGVPDVLDDWLSRPALIRTQGPRLPEINTGFDRFVAWKATP